MASVGFQYTEPSHRVWSAIVVTFWSNRPRIMCQRCGTRAKLGDAALCLLFGWWIQLAPNLAGLRMERSVRPQELESLVRLQLLPLKLSARERDLVVERGLLDPDMETQLRHARSAGSKLVVSLNLEDIDDLLGCVAAEANHCDDAKVKTVQT